MERPSRGIPSIPSSEGVVRDLWALSLFHTARWPEVCPLHLPVFLTGGKDGFAPRRTFLEPTEAVREAAGAQSVGLGWWSPVAHACLEASGVCKRPWCPSETHFSRLADLCSQRHNLAREER